MTWFQRYGIPGVYFWGLCLLWTLALYPCVVRQVLTTKWEGDAIIVAIAGSSFLPIGYLLYVAQQLVYLLWKWWPHPGITMRALKAHEVLDVEGTEGKYQFQLEPEACLLEVQAALPGGKTRPDSCTGTGRLTIEAARFLSDWIRSRNDVMAIDASMMIASVTAPFVVLIVLMPVGLQVDRCWLLFAIILWIVIFAVLLTSWWIMSLEVVRVERGIYKILSGEAASEIKVRAKIDQ
jgi:hypothetical protein